MIDFNREFLKKILKEKKINYYQLAEMSKISHSTIKHIMNNTIKNPRIDTISAIYKALDIEQINNNASEIQKIYDNLNRPHQKMLIGFGKELLRAENQNPEIILNFIKEKEDEY